MTCFDVVMGRVFQDTVGQVDGDPCGCDVAVRVDGVGGGGGHDVTFYRSNAMLNALVGCIEMLTSDCVQQIHSRRRRYIPAHCL